MSDAMERTTAKIYQFPAGGRRTRATVAAALVPAESVAPARGVRIMRGPAWYHDEAIEDAEPPRKR